MTVEYFCKSIKCALFPNFRFRIGLVQGVHTALRKFGRIKFQAPPLFIDSKFRIQSETSSFADSFNTIEVL